MKMKDYAIISLHEKGFWQVDVYWKMEEPPVEGDSPDHFKTCKIGEDIGRAKEWAKNWYPNAEILIAEDEDYEDDDASVTNGERA
jgi:hypothetical protein